MVEVASGWGSAEGPRVEGGGRKWILVFKTLKNKAAIVFLGKLKAWGEELGFSGQGNSLKAAGRSGEVGGGGRFNFRSEVHLLEERYE